MLKPFSLARPENVADATETRLRHGDDAQFYAGGTELLLLMKQRLAAFDLLIDIKRIPGLDCIRLAAEHDRLIIGAAATHRAVEFSQLVSAELPLLIEIERQVANVRVRAVGTVGGNLCFAEPHSDLSTACVLLDASLRLVNPAGQERLVPAAAFFVGAYTTVREPEELLVAVEFPRYQGRVAGAYHRFEYHARPSVAAGVHLLATPDGRIDSARVAVGCAGPKPVRVRQAEVELAGLTAAQARSLAPAVQRWSAGASAAEEDLTGSAEFKANLAGVFAGRALVDAIARLERGDVHDPGGA